MTNPIYKIPSAREVQRLLRGSRAWLYIPEHRRQSLRFSERPPGRSTSPVQTKAKKCLPAATSATPIGVQCLYGTLSKRCPDPALAVGCGSLVLRYRRCPPEGYRQVFLCASDVRPGPRRSRKYFPFHFRENKWNLSLNAEWGLHHGLRL